MLAEWGRFFRRHPRFAALWGAQSFSAFGGAITTVALPLVAVVVFDASPWEMGVLTTLTALPPLVFGLFAGVWVDRTSRRRILIVTDVVRAAALASVPILAAVDLLRIEHLYVVAFLVGTLTLLADSAAIALVPLLVRRDDLVHANSASMFSLSLAGSAGPSIAGALTQLLSAPFAIAVNAGASLVAAVCGLLVKEPAAPRRKKSPMWSEIADGMRELFRDSTTSALAISATIGTFAAALRTPILILFLVRDLAMTPVVVGLAVTAAGAASVAGALLSPRLSAWLGHGWVYIAGQVAGCVGGFVTVAASGPAWLAVLVVVAGQAMTGFGGPLYVIQQRTIRQALTPSELLGRVTATWRFFLYGAMSLGAMLGGALGAVAGLRATIAVSAAGGLLAVAWTVCSPLKSLRQLPATADEAMG